MPLVSSILVSPIDQIHLQMQQVVRVIVNTEMKEKQKNIYFVYSPHRLLFAQYFHEMHIAFCNFIAKILTFE